jgi:hypothetical protein
MAKVKIQGHASGTGILTVTAPNTSTDRTITLPDGTGTLIADDGSGNVGIGVTPESWQSTWKMLQIADGASIGGRTNSGNMELCSNAYRDSVDSQWEYIGANGSEEAAKYTQFEGGHTFYIAPSGSADAAISWTTAMTIDNNGYVTMPNQPCASFGWSSHISADSVIPADLIRVNIGSHLNSSGRFTAPVAGTYWYGYVGMSQAADANLKVELLKNGSVYENDTRAYTHNVVYNQNSIFGFITLSANDYLEFKPQNTTLHSNYGQISIKLVA